MRSLNGVWGLVVMVVVSCAAPSRRLTPRQVEDPIVVPRGMASASISGGAAHYWPTDGNASQLVPSFRYGITDRLELGLLSLRYAFLDDAPTGASPSAPLSLALQGGALGLGWGSIDGLIVQPVVALRAAKHVGNRWRFDAGVGWIGQWTSKNTTFPVFYDEALAYHTRHFSGVDVDVRATRQLADRVALGAGASAGQAHGCLSTFCDWANRSVAGSLHLSLRPWHWLTLGITGIAGARWRPASYTPPVDPDAPPPSSVRSVTWLSAGGWAAFYW